MCIRDSRVVAHFDALSDDDYAFTCTIVKGEILFGIERLPTGRRRQSLETQVVNLFAALPCLETPEHTADYYAQMKKQAEQQGTPLSDNDFWIAATAMTLDAVLVTSDLDFQRIVGFGLQLEDWTG